MAKWIKLTDYLDNPIYLKINQISVIKVASEGGTIIMMGNEKFSLKDDIKSVMSKLEDAVLTSSIQV